tara:strand:+ start:699 stop:1064 length:366 start_codon:yes stop_codon:yes gene_type:complete
MFANYDYTEFPEVKVTFDGSINSEIDFTLFIDQWINLYEDQINFTFLFDMSGMGNVNPIYCYKMSRFISELKGYEHQYLLSTKIINVNKYLKYLLLLIFALQKPVAKVTIVYNDSEIIIEP